MSPVAGMEFSLFTSSAFNPWYTQWACGSLTPVPLADEIMKAEDTYIFVGWLTRNKGLLSIGKGASIWTCFVCSRHRFGGSGILVILYLYMILRVAKLEELDWDVI